MNVGKARVTRTNGVGAGRPRHADRRDVRGTCCFAADQKSPRLPEVAFVQSLLAHFRYEGGVSDKVARSRLGTRAPHRFLRPMQTAPSRCWMRPGRTRAGSVRQPP